MNIDGSRASSRNFVYVNYASDKGK